MFVLVLNAFYEINIPTSAIIKFTVQGNLVHYFIKFSVTNKFIEYPLPVRVYFIYQPAIYYSSIH